MARCWWPTGGRASCGASRGTSGRGCPRRRAPFVSPLTSHDQTEEERMRSLQQRTRDTLDKLRPEVDLWVASAGGDGEAYLVPLSFVWDGRALTVATPVESRTARNLTRAGWARVGLGPTRDVVMLEG